MEHNTPTPENPLCIGAAKPRLPRCKKSLITPPGVNLQKELNALADYLESVPLSQEARLTIKRALIVCHNETYAMDDCISNAAKLVGRLRAQLDEATIPHSPVPPEITTPPASFWSCTTEEAMDELRELATALDVCAALDAATRKNINDHLSQITCMLDVLDDSLHDARIDLESAKEDADREESRADKLKYIPESIASTLDNSAPHLLDDLLDLTAKLRHNNGDPATIRLLELTTTTLKSIIKLII